MIKEIETFAQALLFLRKNKHYVYKHDTGYFKVVDSEMDIDLDAEKRYENEEEIITYAEMLRLAIEAKG